MTTNKETVVTPNASTDAPTLLSDDEQSRREAAAAQQAAPAVQQQQQQQQPAQTPAEVAALNDYLRDKYGVDLDALLSQVQPAQQQQQQPAQQNADPMAAELMQAWNVDSGEFDRRLKLVVNEFNKLPEAERALYDNAQGAMILWDRINKTAPSVDRGLTGRTGASNVQGAEYQYTLEQLRTMSPDERRRNHQQVANAYYQNKVLRPF